LDRSGKRGKGGDGGVVKGVPSGMIMPGSGPARAGLAGAFGPAHMMRLTMANQVGRGFRV